MNEEELRNMMYTAQLKNIGTVAIRYPRGRGTMTDWQRPFKEIRIGEARMVKQGKDIALLTIGYAGVLAQEALVRLEEENIEVEHWDMRFVKPVDSECLHGIFKSFKKIVVVEDGVLNGGFGSSVVEFMADNGYRADVKRLGVPDSFIDHGTPAQLYHECGYDAEGIYNAIKSMVVPRLLSKAG
jgi:1-deoxy-D-xylulose-5-phosphate synthase